MFGNIACHPEAVPNAKVPPVMRLIPLLLVLSLLGAACGGGEDDVAEDIVDPAVATATVDPAEELPQFESDFDRVCTTQVGFGGASPYIREGGPRPTLLFQETDSGTLITSSLDLPAGWLVEQDSDFEDNSDLAPTELVACSVVVDRQPNGVSCDLEGDDGSVTSLALVDTTYEMTVYEATTGAVVGNEKIEAFDTECPLFVFVDEDQTEYVNTPDADQYTNALRPFVMPGS